MCLYSVSINSWEILSKDTNVYFVAGSGKYIWVNPNLEIDEVK